MEVEGTGETLGRESGLLMLGAPDPGIVGALNLKRDWNVPPISRVLLGLHASGYQLTLRGVSVLWNLISMVSFVRNEPKRYQGSNR